MALGKLPGRLVSAAKGIAGGGYDKEPEGKKYDTADPRQAFWRGMSEDVSRVMMGQAPRGAAHGYAQDAIRYNEVGPERYAQRQILQGRAAQAERQGQQQEAAMQMWNQDPNGRQAGVPFAAWMESQSPQGLSDERSGPSKNWDRGLQIYQDVINKGGTQQQAEAARNRFETNYVRSGKIVDVGGGLYRPVLADGTLGPPLNTKEELTTGITAAETAKADVAADLTEEQEAIKQMADIQSEAVETVTALWDSLPLFDQAIAAIDEGAESGAIQSRFPSLKEASVKLDNLRTRLGLNVVQATRFGALSEGEREVAFEAAIPLGLDAPALRKWLVNKKAANQKLQKAYMDAIRFAKSRNPDGSRRNIADYAEYLEQQRGTQETGKQTDRRADLEARMRALGVPVDGTN